MEKSVECKSCTLLVEYIQLTGVKSLYSMMEANSLSIVIGRILFGEGGSSILSGSINISWLLWGRGVRSVHNEMLTKSQK